MTHIISSQSPHFRFMERYGFIHRNYYGDICNYRQRLIGAIVMVAVCGTTFAFATIYPFLDLALYYFAYTNNGSSVSLSTMWNDSVIGSTVLTAYAIIIGTIAVGFGVVHCTTLWQAHYDNKSWNDKPSTVSVMWSSFKNKYCVKVEIK